MSRASRRMVFPMGVTEEQRKEQEKTMAFEELERNASQFLVTSGMAAAVADAKDGSGYTGTDQDKQEIATLVKRAWDFAEAFEAESNARAEKLGIK